MEEHEDKIAKLMMEGYSDFEILKRMGVDSFERRYAYKQTFEFLTKGNGFPSSSFFIFVFQNDSSIAHRKKNTTTDRHQESLRECTYGTQ